MGLACNEICRQLQVETPSATAVALSDLLRTVAEQRRGAQRIITRWRERARFQALDVDIRGLPPTDMRRSAWLNTDRFSTVWVPAWPTSDLELSDPEFREATTFYFGLPSPACAVSVGERIANTRRVIDAHGTSLTAATLPGDGWRTQHDALKWRIAQDAAEMHVRLRHEVYGLFAACIPQGAQA